MPDSGRFLEEAADELGRLEAISAYAPPAVTIAVRLASIAKLVNLETPGSTRLTLESLAAAEGDALHDGELPAAALHWRTLIETEERRVRGGAPLTSQRFAIVAPALATYSDRPQLEAIWRESGLSRPVLMRALDAAAWSPTAALGEACAALMLCAGGRTDRVRLLPFADAASHTGEEGNGTSSTRETAITAWRAGERSPWAELGLVSTARRARATRVATEGLLRSLVEEDANLDTLGRAAITARRALACMRGRFVITMPALADELELSRPAASDALDRLVASGLTREMTGRARDRVYAWGAACAIAGALADS